MTIPATSIGSHRQSRSAERRVSLVRLTLRALVLPLLHPRQTVAAGLFPFAIVVATARFSPEVSPLSLVCPGVSAAVVLRVLGEAVSQQPLLGLIWLANLAALAFWFCAWQREAALRFPQSDRNQSMDSWLPPSLRRLPQYLPAFAIWFAASSLLTSVLRFAIRDAAVLLSADPYDPVDSGHAAIRLTIMLLMLPVSLWVFARLSLLPVLVAANGWPKAFTVAVRLTRGSLGVKLMLAVLGLLLIVQLLAFGAQSLASAVIGTGELFRLITVFGWIALTAGLIGQLWLASLTGLVTGSLTTPMAVIDPATFD